MCYNEFMTPHFLQTSAWGDFINSEGEKTFHIKEKDFEALCTLKKTKVGNYLFLPYGPTLKDEKALKPALAKIEELAKENDCIFIRIEPTIQISEKTISALKLKKTKDLDPKHTIILDLAPSEEELLLNMEQKKRQIYRNYYKKGITIRQSRDKEDGKILLNYLHQLSDKRNFLPHSDEYLLNQLNFDFAKLYIAEFEGKAIGAALIYDTKDTRYYAHAAASEEHRKLSPGVAILTQMIMDAKKNGQKYFDFWGATDSQDPNHPWYHFTQYKLTFGGKMVEYAGTYDYIISGTKYKIYTALRKANRLKRKILK